MVGEGGLFIGVQRHEGILGGYLNVVCFPALRMLRIMIFHCERRRFCIVANANASSAVRAGNRGWHVLFIDRRKGGEGMFLVKKDEATKAKMERRKRNNR